MDIIDLIEKKRDQQSLSRDEYFYLTESIVRHEIADYQLASLLMAIYLNDCNREETFWLTEAMIASGQTIDLAAEPSFIVDKHSTGGVGDKTTLVLLPILAACGLDICKLSGHGLGHTGGTLDKLTVFEGFRSNLTLAAIKRLFYRNRIVIGGQTEDIVPADKIIYALRDVTATVGSLPLIASSIMSKKLAGPAKGLVLDVKCGSGAHMKNLTQAQNLARLMTYIGNHYGIQTQALITNMHEPLGFAIGNSLEVQEAIDTLKGKSVPDLLTLCLELGKVLLQMAHPDWESLQCYQRIQGCIKDGTALKSLQSLIEHQDGRWSEEFPLAKFQQNILSPHNGVVQKIDALAIGESAMALGAGRHQKDDKIDLQAGILLHKKCGDKVVKNEPLFTLFTNVERKMNLGLSGVKDAFSISDEELNDIPVILDNI